MVYDKVIIVVLINVILMEICRNAMAYTQISTGENVDGGGPKLYKAVNFDLFFPKSFNSSENVISTTPETIPSPTERATSVVGQPYYPLPQSNQPTYTAATPIEKQQEPTLFVTPAPTQEPTQLAATSNEAGSYDTQQNMNGNKYNAQVVTQNAINIQQQQQLNDNNKAEKEQQQNFATGRAVDYHTSYPFGQVITPLIKNVPHPVYRKPVTSFSTFPSSTLSLGAAKLAAASSSNAGKIIYPQAIYQRKPASQAEIDKLRGKAKFIDRFSPSEGVAPHIFKSNSGNSHDHSQEHVHDYHNHALSYKPAGKTPSASNVVSSYVSPNNLYAFPPNNVNYPSNAQDTKVSLLSGTINSYTWPAAGPLKDTKNNLNTASSNPYQYNGPINAGYLPPASDGDAVATMDEGKNNDGDGTQDNGEDDNSVGVLPASAMNQASGDNNGDMTADMIGSMSGPTDSQDDKTPDDNSYDTEKEYPTPPPGWLKEHPESAGEHPESAGEHPHHYDHHPRKPDIEFVHDNSFHHHPDIIFDDVHHHDHYPSYPAYHHYPEIIYDDHHNHQHIEHPPPTTTTEAPPPEPPPEPRVKKYSYFYIGRKLWYIPLYFTVWFSFYVLWLILKSIARHKVNLPNHYVSRRSLENYDLSKNQNEIINQLNVSVLDKIDKFKRKYMI